MARQQADRQGGQQRPGVARRLGRGALRWTRRTLVLLLVLLALLAALYVSRERTLHPLLVRVLPDLSRSLTPYEVTVEAIDGDWRSEVRLSGIEVRPLDPAAPLVRATCAALSAEGDLVAAALRGDPGALSLVQVTAPSVEVDVTRGEDEPGAEARSPVLPPLPPFRVVEGQVRVITGGDVIDLSDLSIERGSVAGPVTLEGAATANAWSAEVRSRVNLTPEAILFEGDLVRGTAQDLTASADGLAGQVRGGVLGLQQGVVRVGSNQVEVDSLSVDLRDPGAPTIGGLVRLELPRLDELEATVRAARGEASGAEGVPAPTYFGAVRGRASLTPAPGRIATGEFELEGEDVVVAGLRLGRVRTTLLASDLAVEVPRLLIEDPGRVSVEGRGALDLEGSTLSDVELTVRMAQPELLLPGTHFLGELEADLRLSGPLLRPSGAVRVEAVRLRADGEDLGEVGLEGTFEGGNLEVTRLDLDTEHGEVLAGGTVRLPLAGDALAVELTTLALRRGDARLALTGPTTIDFEGDGVAVRDLSLAGPVGALTLRVDHDPREGLRVSGTAAGFQLDAALRGTLAVEGQLGVLDGRLSFRESPLQATVDATLSNARIAGVADPVTARIDVDWSDGRLRIEELTASLPHVSLDVRGDAPLDLGEAPLGPGPLRLAARARVDADALRGDLFDVTLPEDVAAALGRLAGRLELDLDLDGTWRAVRGAGVARLDGVRYVDAQGAPLPGLEDPVSGEVAVTVDDGVTLRPSALVLGDLGVADGRLRVQRPLDLAELLSTPAPWLAAPLEADGTFTCEDLAWVESLSEEVREVSGSLTFEGRARGTLESPVLDGRLSLEGGALRLRGAPSVEDLRFSIAATPDRLEVERADFTVGAAPVALSGAVTLESSPPLIALHLEGERVLLHRSQAAVVRSNIDLDLTGSPGDLLLSGDVALVGGRLRSPVEFQSILSSGGSRAPDAVRRGLRLPAFGPPSLGLAIEVTTADPMRIDGRLTRGQVRADLELTGDASHPIPSGKLFVDPLEVALPAGTLRFPTGLVTFDPSNPDVPQLELLGSTRLAGYDVTVEISGEYDEAVVDFSSSPPLAPDDLVMLVLSGRPPGTARGARAAGQAVALYVARDLVQGWFDSGGFEEDDRSSFLDRFEVVSGRDVSRSGVLTVQATYRLREGLARDRDAVYLVMERDSFEDYNVGLRLVLRLE